MSIKFYKHNKRGEVVAVTKTDRFEDSYKVLYCDGSVGYFSSDHVREYFIPLPEAPKVNSTPWAILMLEKGCKVRQKSWKNKEFYIFKEGNCIIGANRDLHGIDELANDWELYEAPKVIIEKLPHEFEKGEEVLVRGEPADEKEWFKTTFSDYKPYRQYVFGVDAESIFKKLYWPYCLPYAGNEHLEGTVTEGDHGAVPDGYIPPHVPKLGDADYWMVGDEVINLATQKVDVIQTIRYNRCVILSAEELSFWEDGTFLCADSNSIRVLYHKGSYVREDGTVHEHVPTRPYRIEKE